MDMNKLLKQAQKMQREVAKQQEAMAAKVFEASSVGLLRGTTSRASHHHQQRPL